MSGRELIALTLPQALGALAGAWLMPLWSVFTVAADVERTRTLAPLRLTGLS